MTTIEPSVFVAAVDRDRRRAYLAEHPTEDGTQRNGIDFVEVVSNHRHSTGYVHGAPQQRTLLVHLIRPVADASVWERVRPTVSGGVRQDPKVNPVAVDWAYPASAVAGAPGVSPDPALPGVHDADRTLVDRSLPADAEARNSALVVRTSSSGDWSTYTLHLLDAHDDGIPAQFDPPLAQSDFEFTVDCPNPFDCRAPSVPVPQTPSPLIDYLARDYDALRVRLLDRFAALVPSWTDQNAADPAVMLLELFAATGDRLAYWQDAVAVEAYLSTARLRTSIRRHARLLDYSLREAVAARAWLAFSTDIESVVRAGLPVTDIATQPGWRAVDAHEAGGLVMETLADVPLHPARNAIELHAWEDADWVLAAGSTSAFVRYPAGPATDPGLAAGDVLILADLPADGPADVVERVQLGRPTSRFAVRLNRAPVLHHDPYLDPAHVVLEIAWNADDALPTPLQVSEGGRTRAVALANVVLADQGASVPDEQLAYQSRYPGRDFRPRLARTGVAYAVPPRVPNADDSAASLVLSSGDPLAAVTLNDGSRTWEARPDLLASGSLDPHFVVETEDDGVARLRFGDGVNGRDPGDAALSATYRLGRGARGNVGAGRLTSILERVNPEPGGDGAHLTVWNPLPGVGGADAEPIDQARRLAPTSYRQQLRAVTTRDYADVADELSSVQRAVARRRWAGSWYAEEVLVDPVASRLDDPSLPGQVTELLEVRRMAGIDVEVRRPVYVPLLVEISGCARPDAVTADVTLALLETFSSRTLFDGTLGFFHPDRFTFGQPLYLSDVIARGMSTPGISWMQVTRFARLDGSDADSAANLTAGRIDAGPTEVLLCASDPDNPENGRVDITLDGGQ